MSLPSHQDIAYHDLEHRTRYIASCVLCQKAIPPGVKRMKTSWGNPEEHSAAFKAAMEEFYRQHPDQAGRKLFELDRESRTHVLARQVQIYRERTA
jgi:hypothetical protein